MSNRQGLWHYIEDGGQEHGRRICLETEAEKTLLLCFLSSPIIVSQLLLDVPSSPLTFALGVYPAGSLFHLSSSC
jgi:hypothetical protein